MIGEPQFRSDLKPPSDEEPTFREGRKFEIGEKVKVRRTSGEIDDGWEVVGVDEFGKATVCKGEATKRISESALAELNP